MKEVYWLLSLEMFMTWRLICVHAFYAYIFGVITFMYTSWVCVSLY